MKRTITIALLFVTVLAAANDEIVVQPETPAQGKPFLIIINSDKPMVWANGELFGVNLHLEPVESALIGLGGIPRNQKPGSYTLKLTVQYTDGTSATLERNITVQSHTFETQKLRVDPKYVSLSAEDLKWVRKDNKAAGEAYRATANTMLWKRGFIKPAEGRWSSPFGVRRMFNGQERSFHSGADIAIPTGTPVKASNDGRIALVRHMFFGGKTVLIDHGYGVFTGYMHLSEFKVEQGDLVERGQVIGISGSTGRVTGPHLHWMLRIGSEKLDAAGLLAFNLE